MSLSSLFFSFNEFFIFMSPCDEGILIYDWTIEKMGFNLCLQKKNIIILKERSALFSL